MGSFLRSYKYGKIRVRLMRTEGDGNENEGHFVSVGARLASLPSVCVYAYAAYLAFAKLEESYRISACRFASAREGRCVRSYRLFCLRWSRAWEIAFFFCFLRGICVCACFVAGDKF